MAALVQNSPTGPIRHALGEKTWVGRSPECEIVLGDASVSRKHAHLALVGDKYKLFDEGSRFGCFLNGAQVSSSTVSHGDVVKFGNVAMRFDAEERGGPDEVTVIAATGAAASAQLVARIAVLERERHRSECLLALHATALRAGSGAMLLTDAGPELIRALGADRAVVLAREPNSGQRIVRFQHNLGSIPEERLPEVQAAIACDTPFHTGPGADGRIALVVPIPAQEGNSAAGAVYLELPPGKLLAPDDMELLKGLCSVLGAALGPLEARVQEARRPSGRICTVLHATVPGLAGLTELLPPEAVIALVEEYLAAAVAVIAEAQGSVERLSGTTLVAIFGGPGEHPDHGARALQAARRLRDMTDQLRSRWEARPWAGELDLSGVGVAVGIETGAAVLGEAGPLARRAPALLGTAPAAAARLCAAANPGAILIGPEAAASGEPVQLLKPEELPGWPRLQAFELLE